MYNLKYSTISRLFVRNLRWCNNQEYTSKWLNSTTISEVVTQWKSEPQRQECKRIYYSHALHATCVRILKCWHFGNTIYYESPFIDPLCYICKHTTYHITIMHWTREISGSWGYQSKGTDTFLVCNDKELSALTKHTCTTIPPWWNEQQL